MKYKAVYNYTAFSGIGVVDVEYGIDDYLICEEFSQQTDGIKVIPHRLKIYSDNHGEAFVKLYGRRYFLRNFMRSYFSEDFLKSNV